MEVGFFFWPYSPDLVLRMAKAANRYGFDLIGIADTPGNAMDPWVAATMVAGATERGRLAIRVSNLASRHPAVSAAGIASLDLLAPNRVILGLGTGHSGTRNIGLARSGVAELAAGTVFIRQLLAGRPATWQGAKAHLPWVQRSSPVFIAGFGPGPRCGGQNGGRRFRQFRHRRGKPLPDRNSGDCRCPRSRA